MSIQIDIDEAQVKLLKEFYKTRVNEIQSEISKLTAEIEELGRFAKKLDFKPNEVDITLPDPSAKYSSSGYQDRWPWVKKAAFLIEDEGRPLSTKDMVELILEKYEPKLKDKRKTVVASLSAVMSTKTKEGLFTRVTNQFGEFEFSVANNKKPTVSAAGDLGFTVS
mgnify:CR=1 FL=1